MKKLDILNIQQLLNENYDYMYGNCGLLALKLHDLTGYPITVLSNTDGEPWSMGEDDDGIEYTHVVVEHPSGKYLDALGLRTNQQISQDFDLEYMDSYDITREQLVELLGDDGPFDCYLEPGEVDQFAQQLIKKYIQF
jgi:hypothetical protein